MKPDDPRGQPGLHALCRRANAQAAAQRNDAGGGVAGLSRRRRGGLPAAGVLGILSLLMLAVVAARFEGGFAPADAPAVRSAAGAIAATPLPIPIPAANHPAQPVRSEGGSSITERAEPASAAASSPAGTPAGAAAAPVGTTADESELERSQPGGSC